jgi:hypothetical protein
MRLLCLIRHYLLKIIVIITYLLHGGLIEVYLMTQRVLIFFCCDAEVRYCLCGTVAANGPIGHSQMTDE